MNAVEAEIDIGRTSSNRPRFGWTLYALTVFLSSFLLFQVQPIFAKIILPWFGGSAGVWTVCMLFFQAVLLLGYIYAHWSITCLSARKQLLLHTALLALCIPLLPLSISQAWKPAAGDDPTIRILALLAAKVGLPYLLLSTTGPLVQAWYTRASVRGKPYRLFAVSNFASAVGLLAYPVLVEPNLIVGQQIRSWSFLFIVFAGFCICTVWISCRMAPQTVPIFGQVLEAKRPDARTALSWVLLAGCASSLLLSVTNHLTANIAPAPFLWVVPLSLYLLSFIICFGKENRYARRVFFVSLPFALGAMAYFLWSGASAPKLWISICIYAVGLFICCMVCHGELARLKPHPRYLTAYFLTIAAGGVLGGIFVGVCAPYFFRSAFEIHIGLVLCALLVAFRLFEDPPATRAAWPRVIAGAGAAFAVALLGFLIFAMWDDAADCIMTGRNFYGVIRVRQQTGEDGTYRSLIHGKIEHGEQWLDDDARRDPTTYYCADTGVGQMLMRDPSAQSRRVGIIGLGVGTLAAYGRAGDTFRFYELNPMVIDVARKWFTYLSDSPARIEIVSGDGRLSLESEPPQDFDLIALDAFNGDSIPVHLLTREAFSLYFRHLKQHGVLAVHISNQYVDLAPMVECVAMSEGKTGILIISGDSENDSCYSADWILVPADGRELKLQSGVRPQGWNRFRPWTDDYSNVFSLLK